MRAAVELSDVHNIRLILEHRRLVVIDIKVVWRAEYGHHRWKTGRFRLSVHAISGIYRLNAIEKASKAGIPSVLSLMRPDD